MLLPMMNNTLPQYSCVLQELPYAGQKEKRIAPSCRIHAPNSTMQYGVLVGKQSLAYIAASAVARFHIVLNFESFHET